MYIVDVFKHIWDLRAYLAYQVFENPISLNVSDLTWKAGSWKAMEWTDRVGLKLGAHSWHRSSNSEQDICGLFINHDASHKPLIDHKVTRDINRCQSLETRSADVRAVRLVPWHRWTDWNSFCQLSTGGNFVPNCMWRTRSIRTWRATLTIPSHQILILNKVWIKFNEALDNGGLQFSKKSTLFFPRTRTSKRGVYLFWENIVMEPPGGVVCSFSHALASTKALRTDW